MTLFLRTAFVAAAMGLAAAPVLAAGTTVDGSFVVANVAPPEEPVPPPADGTTPPADGATAPADAAAPTDATAPAEPAPEATPAADASAAPAEAAPAAEEAAKSGSNMLPIIVGLVVALLVGVGVVMARRKT